jgi:predicted AAA+ superfamily ATPase
MDNIDRYAKIKIAPWLNRHKAIIVIGARQVGKTTLLKTIFNDESHTLWLNADENTTREQLAKQDLESLKHIIGSYKILIIDEVQRIANAGLLLKLLVDNFKDLKVIATGSSSLDISETVFEPLTGRHINFHLYPFSMAELYSGKSPFEIEQQLPFHLVYGCYPDICNNPEIAETLLKNLTNQYLYKDVLIWKDIRRPELLDKLLKLLSFQVGSEVSLHELGNQLQVKSETVENYINLLEKSFVIFRLHAYSTNARKEVTKMSKIYFWDNGVRNAVIGNYSNLNLRNDIGQLWENFMISERMKMNSTMDMPIKSYFWRNYNQSEVDYVEEEKGNLHAYEMKWNTRKKNMVSKAFLNMYSNAKTDIIHPQNFSDFCYL